MFKTVTVVLAVFPEASVTVMLYTPASAVEGITVPTVPLAGKLPAVPVETAVVITCGGVRVRSYQLVCVPLMLIVVAEFAAKPFPVIVIDAPGRTAVGVALSDGLTVKVAVA